jgi:hypothetical protein
MLFQLFFEKKAKKGIFRFPRIDFNQSFPRGLFRPNVAMRGFLGEGFRVGNFRCGIFG